MLFNSFVFILAFLPLVLLGYYRLKATGQYAVTTIYLVVASLVFYGWWNPQYLLLLLASIVGNFALGQFLSSKDYPASMRKHLLAAGVVSNLAVLAYYKYSNFILQNFAWLFSEESNEIRIILPLAISFFTFQQIAYLVDSYQGKTRRYGFLHYCLFVTFFPQLIAGPIVHHREMMPQFVRNRKLPLQAQDIAIGLAIFSLGLFKKVIIADNVALWSTPVFSAADAGTAPSFFLAWQGALAYTLQLYFDFSGYADMATGAARMFGITLPINFNSPYASKNIIEFWRRWHITLSRFLRDYLYIPLGGNRKGPVKRYRNLFITMLLGGLWHGAGWNFVIWGALHGVYLGINHGWHSIRAPALMRSVITWGARPLTLLAVIIGWVFFRAETFSGATSILKGMAGLNGVAIPYKYLERWHNTGPLLQDLGIEFVRDEIKSLSPLPVLLILLLLTTRLPNLYQWFRSYNPVLTPPEPAGPQFQFSRIAAALLAALFVFTLLNLNKASEFLYFQF